MNYIESSQKEQFNSGWKRKFSTVLQYSTLQIESARNIPSSFFHELLCARDLAKISEREEWTTLLVRSNLSIVCLEEWIDWRWGRSCGQDFPQRSWLSLNGSVQTCKEARSQRTRGIIQRAMWATHAGRLGIWLFDHPFSSASPTWMLPWKGLGAW